MPPTCAAVAFRVFSQRERERERERESSDFLNYSLLLRFLTSADNRMPFRLCGLDMEEKHDPSACRHCAPPGVVCHRLVEFLLEDCRVSDIDPNDVVLFKVCMDSGNYCNKLMSMALLKNDPLLKVDQGFGSLVSVLRVLQFFILRRVPFSRKGSSSERVWRLRRRHAYSVHF